MTFYKQLNQKTDFIKKIMNYLRGHNANVLVSDIEVNVVKLTEVINIK